MVETTAARSGEEVDLESLREFLDDRIEGGNENLSVSQFQAGSSNLTYLLRLGSNEYVLRRPPFPVRINGCAASKPAD